MCLRKITGLVTEPRVAAHFHLEHWAQRREKQKRRKRKKTIPAALSRRRESVAEKTAVWGEDRSAGIPVARLAAK